MISAILLFLMITGQDVKGDIEIAPCKFYNEVHGLVDVCAPFVPVFSHYIVEASAPSFGSYTKKFKSFEEAKIYAYEFKKVVEEWQKIHYTNYYDYGYHVVVKPIYNLVLPKGYKE